MDSDQLEQLEEDRQSTLKEDVLILSGAVIIFNIILVFGWVIYVFTSYDDFSHYKYSQKEFAIFDEWMKLSIPVDILVGIALNVIFFVVAYRWLKKFRAKKSIPEYKD